MEKRGVEATVIGRFNNGKRGVVRYNGKKIFDLDMAFLHDGLPNKVLNTVYEKKVHEYRDFDDPRDLTEIFYDMASRLNTASFEFISTQYDHEVQGNSVIKPLQGRGKVNGNASVIRPVLDSYKGVVLSQGLYPSYSDIDTYWMAACSIDTAVRNAISVGGSLDVLALLDNFCWCDSTNPERLGQLKEAARACYDFAVSYGTPFVSGKDSMFNDFKGYDEDFNEVMISVPPTLLISSIGVIDDIRKCLGIDFKYPADLIYIIGTTDDELGGSEYLAFMGEKISGKKYIGDNVPKVNADDFIKVYSAFENAIDNRLIASSISIERGGLGLALARCSLSGLLGFTADLSSVPVGDVNRNDTILYSESQGRLLVSVNPANRKEFEKTFSGFPVGLIGTVSDNRDIQVKGIDGNTVIDADIDKLMERYKGVFKGF